MKKLFLAWQDPESRRWFPIGRLISDSKKYQFAYTYGIKKAQEEANFQVLHSFPKLDKVYTSSEIFPLFANRLMRPSRPDYQDYIQWLDLHKNQADPLVILGRSGGKKATDNFEVFPEPERNENGDHYLHFFAHGLRHMPECSQEKVMQLQLEEALFLAHDLQNNYDSQALLLLTEQKHILGYCPRYLAADVGEVLQENPQSVSVQVKRVNPAPTPIQLRLLCKMTVQNSQNFSPFSTQDYQPVVDPLR